MGTGCGGTLVRCWHTRGCNNLNKPGVAGWRLLQGMAAVAATVEAAAAAARPASTASPGAPATGSAPSAS